MNVSNKSFKDEARNSQIKLIQLTNLLMYPTVDFDVTMFALMFTLTIKVN